MARPPQHSATAPITFISTKDPSWKNEKFGDESRQLSGDELAEHIVRLYLAGLTRGDLSASDPQGRTIREYLTAEEPPDEVRIRRLKSTEVARCRDMGGRAGLLAAAQLALEQKADAFEEECDLRGLAWVFELGEFALRCSEAPRPGESMRSGSSHGG